MTTRTPTSVEEYLAALPDDRRDMILTVRQTILKNLPNGYVESVNWGMLAYEIPLKRYPKTYNGQPLMFAALASQKNYCSLYLMCAYQDSAQLKQLQEAFTQAGKKLDMGKSCIRFRKLEDLPLNAIGEILASTSPDQFIQIYEASRSPKRRTKES